MLHRKIQFFALITALCSSVLGGCGRRDAPGPNPAPTGKAFTFAVMGDNRGESDGSAAPIFTRIIRSIQNDRPELAFNTGDLINGYAGENEAHLRMLWDGYKKAVSPLKMPVYNTPGNHDLFDATSARLWKELWGPTYYTVDRNGVRFIVLDSETTPGRLGETQFRWLEGQLEGAGDRPVFVFLHRPLYPVDGHIGSSMDMFPKERDRLHGLFVKHKDRIKEVFLGHEHLFYKENRDGISYCIVAGGGAELYVPPELGGYYHYLLIRVDGDRVTTEVKRVGVPPDPRPAAVSLEPGALLEGWEDPVFWYGWDQSVLREPDGRYHSQGNQGLKVSFDFALYPWPLLMANLSPARDLTPYRSLAVDVYVPEAMKGRLSVQPDLKGDEEHKGPSVPLHPGWNTVRTPLVDAWLPRAERAKVQLVQWILQSSEKDLAGWVVFDHARLEGAAPAPPTGANTASPNAAGVPLANWESPMLWGVWDENARQEASAQWKTQGALGLEIDYDFNKSNSVVLYGTPKAPWDLDRVSRLSVDVYAPAGSAGALLLQCRLGRMETTSQAPDVSLKPGWNHVSIDLNGPWLTRQGRDSVDLIQWVLRPKGNKSAGEVVFDNLRAGG